MICCTLLCRYVWCIETSVEGIVPFSGIKLYGSAGYSPKYVIVSHEQKVPAPLLPNHVSHVHLSTSILVDYPSSFGAPIVAVVICVDWVGLFRPTEFSPRLSVCLPNKNFCFCVFSIHRWRWCNCIHPRMPAENQKLISQRPCLRTRLQNSQK